MAAGFSAGEGPRSLFPLFLSVQNSAHGRLAHPEGPGLALWDEVWTGQCPALKRTDLPGRYNWVLISPLSGWVNHSTSLSLSFLKSWGRYIVGVWLLEG